MASKKADKGSLKLVPILDLNEASVLSDARAWAERVRAAVN